jgi:assimilatory nitrate reductase catalytic subunit
MLDDIGPQQWPLKEGESTGRVRLYEDGVFPTPDGRARFADTPYKPVAEAARGALPLLAEHRPPARPVAWHEPHRHRGPLFGHVAEPMVQMHPQDMARRRSRKATWCT